MLLRCLAKLRPPWRKHSSFFRHSTFGFRHFQRPSRQWNCRGNRVGCDSLLQSGAPAT